MARQRALQCIHRDRPKVYMVALGASRRAPLSVAAMPRKPLYAISIRKGSVENTRDYFRICPLVV